GRLHARELGRRQILIELVDDVVPHLGTAAAQHEGMTLELETRRALDSGYHLIDRLLELRLSLNRLRAFRASCRCGDGQRSPEGRALHAVPSIPSPTAEATTRATS